MLRSEYNTRYSFQGVGSLCNVQDPYWGVFDPQNVQCTFSARGVGPPPLTRGWCINTCAMRTLCFYCNTQRTHTSWLQTFRAILRCLQIFFYLNICAYISIHVYMYSIYTYIYIYIYIYIYQCTHIHIYIYIYTVT